MSGVCSYRDLKVWQKAMDLAVHGYDATSDFPAAERYGLTSQIRRAGVSIPSNIAEGHSRGTTALYIHHLRIALGSQAELETQLEIARRLKLIRPKAFETCSAEARVVGKLLNAIIKKLQPRMSNPTPAPSS